MTERFALIVEDDIDLATIFAQALREVGFETEVVVDGHQAQARLEQSKPDVVVLDLYLPHISGPDLLYQIRSTERLADTLVIIATADPRLGETLQDQADLLLIKPISFRQLRDLAKRLRFTLDQNE